MPVILKGSVPEQAEEENQSDRRTKFYLQIGC